MTFSATMSLAKARMSPFLGSMATRSSRAGADGLLGGRKQGLLYSTDQDITADALFALPEFQNC